MPYKAKVRMLAVMLVSVIDIRITTYSQAMATMYTGVSESARCCGWERGRSENSHQAP